MASQILSQIRDLQNKVNSFPCLRRGIFTILRLASSSGASHVPTQPLTIPSTRSRHCRDSGLPLHTRNSMGTPGDVFESLPAQEVSPSVLFKNSKNLATSSCGLRPEATGATLVPEIDMRREPQNSSKHGTNFQRGTGVLDHTGGTFSHHGMTDYPRFAISEMHLGNFPDSLVFQTWKVNFKTEVCSKTANHHLTMQWIKEVETAKSIDELMT